MGKGTIICVCAGGVRKITVAGVGRIAIGSADATPWVSSFVVSLGLDWYSEESITILLVAGVSVHRSLVEGLRVSCRPQTLE